MDIHGFRLLNEGEYAVQAWRNEVERAAERGMALVTLDVEGSHICEDTGNSHFDSVEVRDAGTYKLMARFTEQEFAEVDFAREGWFCADAPYQPEY